MTDTIFKLAELGYTILSVGGKTTKQPLNSGGYGLEKWEELQHCEIIKHLNKNGTRFGLRTGIQGNNKYIGSLDWDCCGNKGKDGKRVGCEYTKTKLKQYNEIKSVQDGMFKGGTDGNFNLLFDFTNIPELIQRFKQLQENGKKKIELGSLEIFYSNGSQQVIPPSATLSKITNEIGNSREFLNNEPFIVLKDGMPETNYIIDLLNEYDETKNTTKIVKNKTVIKQIVTPSSSDDEKEEKGYNIKDKYYDLLFKRLGNGFLQNGGKMIDRNDWLVICGALFHNGYSKQMWLDWNEIHYQLRGKRSDSAVKLWNNFEKNNKPVSMGAINNIVKRYKPTEYMEWLQQSQGYLIDNCIMEEQKLLWSDFNVKVPKRTCFTDVGFADIFNKLYGDKFRFTNGFIYHFNGIYWERDNKNYSNINLFIDETFYVDLKKWINGKILYWTKQAVENENDDLNNKGIGFWNRVSISVKDYIKTQRSKAEMIKSICSKICNDKQEWDLNPYIFVFKNCVFDLKLGEKVEPNPLDFMTTCCGWDYDVEYKDLQVNTIIQTIQRDENVRNYLLQAYYSCMVGIQSRNVYIFTGTGGNGKSVLDELLMSMLGDYGYALPKTFLTQPFKDGANPEAIALHNKRCVLVSEPDANKSICCSSLKALSGDSKISSRKLYGEVESVNIVATNIVECNTPPNLDEMNDAMSDRLGEGVIDFNNKFVKQSVYDIMTEEEKVGVGVRNAYYKTDEFKEKYRQSLFHLLLGYRNKTISVPDVVIQSSKGYLAKSDLFYDWFIDNYERNDEAVVKIKSVYSAFKNKNAYSMSKNDKEKYGTEKNFVNNLASNIFVRKYLKQKDDYYNKKQLKSFSLVGWCEKPEEEEDN